MANVSGIVEYKAPNKFGGFSIKVNGQFYNSKFEPKCNKGDHVNFDDGGSKKIVSLSVGAPTASDTNFYSSTPKEQKRYRNNGEEGGFPIHLGAYERALDRRNALMCAVKFAPDADSPEEVVKVARYFEAYTTGDLDRIKAEQLFNDMAGDE